METTLIAWTDRTWNPWRGCTKVSPGCMNCYMFTAQERYGRNPAEVVRCTSTWGHPAKWQKAAAAAGRSELVFTCSWSDWFHQDADPWREDAWAVVRACPNLSFQVLTKRPENVIDRLPADWGDGYSNVWLGVSVEDRKRLPRIDVLRTIPAALRFLSLEPLLEDLGTIDLSGIGWVIAGGESGPGWRPMDHAWAASVRDQCHTAGVPFFFKQSAAPRTETGIELEGKVVREYPRTPLVIVG